MAPRAPRAPRALALLLAIGALASAWPPQNSSAGEGRAWEGSLESSPPKWDLASGDPPGGPSNSTSAGGAAAGPQLEPPGGGTATTEPSAGPEGCPGCAGEGEASAVPPRAVTWPGDGGTVPVALGSPEEPGSARHRLRRIRAAAGGRGLGRAAHPRAGRARPRGRRRGGLGGRPGALGRRLQPEPGPGAGRPRLDRPDVAAGARHGRHGPARAPGRPHGLRHHRRRLLRPVRGGRGTGGLPRGRPGRGGLGAAAGARGGGHALGPARALRRLHALRRRRFLPHHLLLRRRGRRGRAGGRGGRGGGGRRRAGGRERLQTARLGRSGPAGAPAHRAPRRRPPAAARAGRGQPHGLAAAGGAGPARERLRVPERVRAAQQLLPLPLRPRPQLLPQRRPVLPGGEPRGLLPVQHAGLHVAQGHALRVHRHRLPGDVRGRGLGRARGAAALHAHRVLRQEALPAQDGEQQTAQDQIPHPVRAAQRQLLPVHHRRGLPPKRRSQRSPQAAGLAEILPEGRGAVQHPQLDVAQARRRQRGAGRGGAELPPEQPDVSGGPGAAAGPEPGSGSPRPAASPPAPRPSRSVACFGVFCTEENKNSSH